MSLLGSFDDWLTGQPQGTTDAQNAADASANAQLAVLNQQTADNIAASQGAAAAQTYQDQVASDYSTDAPAPGSVAANAEIAVAGAQGAADALANPGTAFASGFSAIANWLKTQALAALQIPWWVWLLIAGGIFLWLGGGGFLERKSRKALSQ